MFGRVSQNRCNSFCILDVMRFLPSTQVLSPNFASQRLIIMEEPKIGKLNKTRNIVLFLLALSCVPYMFPMESRPLWYRDGLSKEEITRYQKQQRVNRFLGGEIQEINWDK